eukprot:728194_1
MMTVLQWVFRSLFNEFVLPVCGSALLFNNASPILSLLGYTQNQNHNTKQSLYHYALYQCSIGCMEHYHLISLHSASKLSLYLLRHCGDKQVQIAKLNQKQTNQNLVHATVSRRETYSHSNSVFKQTRT